MKVLLEISRPYIPVYRCLVVSFSSACLGLVVTGAKGLAQGNDLLSQKEYEICIRMTSTNPEEAFERSLAWEDTGGGRPALHCQAIALSRLGHHEDAALRLERLAAAMPDETPENVVAELLAHAGISWQQAGNYDRARAVQTNALELSPNNPDIHVDRAVSLFETNNYWEAIDDINEALEVSSNRADLYAFRASACRHVDAMELAMEDANLALTEDPENPEALLERGIAHRLLGDFNAARADWLRLIDLHDGRPVAEMARRNLELLDATPPAAEKSGR